MLSAVAGLLLLLWVASDLVGLVVLGAVLAYLFAPVVNRLERRGLGRTQASVLVLVVLSLVVGALAAIVVPVTLEQAGQLQTQWANGDLLRLAESTEQKLAAWLTFVEPGQVGLVEAIEQFVEPREPVVLGYVPGLLEGIGNSVVVPFVLFALLKDGPMIRRRLLTVVPNRFFEFGMTVLYKADAHLGGYLRGQALIAVLVGTSTAIGLGLLGVDYWLVLGILTGLANFVPYVGFVVSAALTVVVSIVTTGGGDQVVAIAILYVALQTVENVVFQPWITGKNVSMHPVLVLLAILVGGRIGGVLGMALGVPAAAILKVVFVETAVSLRRYHL
ncbi:MAG: AI-2E family transporter [Bacteroidota bacterium]